MVLGRIAIALTGLTAVLGGISVASAQDENRSTDHTNTTTTTTTTTPSGTTTVGPSTTETGQGGEMAPAPGTSAPTTTPAPQNPNYGSTNTTYGEVNTTPNVTYTNPNAVYTPPAGETNVYVNEPAVHHHGYHLITPYGMSASIGGGVMGFTDSAATSRSPVGGGWEARLAFGTRSIIGVEAAYTGTAQNVNALGLDNSAVLISNGVEGDVRFNLVGYMNIVPYVFGGAGWRRYDVTNAAFNVSDVRNSDDVFEIPFGAGVGYAYHGFLFDVRGTVRPTFDNQLFGKNAELHTWSATARLGWEF